jgi:hypothetical protein
LTRGGSTIHYQGVKEIDRIEAIGEHRSNYLDNTLIVRTKCSANNFLDVCEREMKM